MSDAYNRFINIYCNAGKTGVSAETGDFTGLTPPANDIDDDEWILSSNNQNTQPLVVTINSSENQAVYRQCAIRTRKQYETSGDTVIGFTGGKDIVENDTSKGSTIVCWRIAKFQDELENYGIDATTMITRKDESDPDLDPATGRTGYKLNVDRTKLKITEKIESTKYTTFWIMVLAASDENPVIDNSVSIVTTATIAMVEGTSGN